MTRRVQFALYVALSFLDFVATVYLVNNGYAAEANPLIQGFVGFFSSFLMGLAVYKLGFLVMVAVLLRAVHQRDPRASTRLLVFANTVMVALGCWHLYALSVSWSA